MSLLEDLDWAEVRAHYDERVEIHRRLIKLHGAGSEAPFVQLVLGISNAAGNYSAAEHGLGPKILGSNGQASKRVFQLAGDLQSAQEARHVPVVIRQAALKYLSIGVGSEISCMMNPAVCWVANTRSIWTHLVVKHADSIRKADEELRLYRDADSTSEMAYKIWSQIHQLLETSMTRVAEEGAKYATMDGTEPGSIAFLWADAIANALYVQHH